MTRFVQLHLLTSYPPSNPNRDDTGRPKSAKLGGHDRLRISSQCLKRAWRTSEIFEQQLAGHIGTRTRALGREVMDRLVARGCSEKEAQTVAEKIAEQFGVLAKGEVTIQQAAHLSPDELAAAYTLAESMAQGGEADEKTLKALVREKHTAADIAMFGRMLAARPECNTEAAVQVAHAITVHRATVENDFFTAVDDLNRPEDSGSAYMGDAYFGAGLFYVYICIDTDLLLNNIGGDVALAKAALDALIEAATTVAPSGKQNSSGSRVRASYILAEQGTQQPRSLSVAFLKPISGEDVLLESIKAIESTAAAMEQVYGACRDDARTAVSHMENAKGSLAEIKQFAGGVYS
ncbi:MAG: type I-E CRISPR-associated protein Cas7/Cse4/CasC [Chitinimonas sp.]|nr:type I-E CRISPR-associated protein Cas7/Cse4/CasC [Chitinimonas sp.]